MSDGHGFNFFFNVLLVQVTDTITLESKGQPRLTCGRWNPHHNCSQVATANETTIRGWDLRSKQWGNISLPSGLTLVYKQRMNNCCGLVTCMQVMAGYCSTFLVPVFCLSWSCSTLPATFLCSLPWFKKERKKFVCLLKIEWKCGKFRSAGEHSCGKSRQHRVEQ